MDLDSNSRMEHDVLVLVWSRIWTRLVARVDIYVCMYAR